MLIVTVLVILIFVILFREEIKTLIAGAILGLIAYGFWSNDAWWGKVVGGILFALLIIGIIGNIVESFTGKKSN